MQRRQEHPAGRRAISDNIISQNRSWPISNPPTNLNDPLAIYWDKKVSELVDVENTRIAAEEAEPHTIFSLLVMALVSGTFRKNSWRAICRVRSLPGECAVSADPACVVNRRQSLTVASPARPG
jgi:hypothetical protein